MALITNLEVTMNPSGIRFKIIQKLVLAVLLAVFISASAAAAAAQKASFLKLGQMPGVWRAAGTYASAISGDGSTIMGYGWVCANGGTS